MSFHKTCQVKRKSWERKPEKCIGAVVIKTYLSAGLGSYEPCYSAVVVVVGSDENPKE
jgi:hypothetical protein